LVRDTAGKEAPDKFPYQSSKKKIVGDERGLDGVVWDHAPTRWYTLGGRKRDQVGKWPYPNFGQKDVQSCSKKKGFLKVDGWGWGR